MMRDLAEIYLGLLALLATLNRFYPGGFHGHLAVERASRHARPPAEQQRREDRERKQRRGAVG